MDSYVLSDDAHEYIIRRLGGHPCSTDESSSDLAIGVVDVLYSIVAPRHIGKNGRQSGLLKIMNSEQRARRPASCPRRRHTVAYEDENNKGWSLLNLSVDRGTLLGR